MEPYFLEDLDNSKLRKSDRILVLEKIEGKNTINSTGLVENRLFTGENELHAIMDEQSCLWSLKYKMGSPPEPLKQRFTSFRALYKFAEDYFLKRNIRIKEVLD